MANHNNGKILYIQEICDEKPHTTHPCFENSAVTWKYNIQSALQRLLCHQSWPMEGSKHELAKKLQKWEISGISSLGIGTFEQQKDYYLTNNITTRNKIMQAFN